MSNREQIVTNGCSGGCCEAFTLPVTIEELDAIIAAREAGLTLYTNRFGKEVHTNHHLDEVKKIRDMVIFLGESEDCPQTGKTFSQNYLDGGHGKLENIDVERAKLWYNVKEGNKLFGLIYTCKHFDNVNKICGNYDNRPNLCRNFGDTCQYKGCTFKQKTIEQLYEITNQHPQRQQGDVQDMHLQGQPEGDNTTASGRDTNILDERN